MSLDNPIISSKPIIIPWTSSLSNILSHLCETVEYYKSVKCTIYRLKGPN